MQPPWEFIGPEPEEGQEESRALLRFSSRRDPAAVAEFVALRVIDTEQHDWLRGYWAARQYSGRTGHLRVQLGEVEGAFPLGRWVRRQRAAYASGQMDGKRAARLERLGMVWSPADAEWADNLAAAALYAARYGTLAAPRSAVISEVGGNPGRVLEGGTGAPGQPIGQWLTNCRRPGALTAERAARLAAIDPDWNPAWPIDWQRHYAGLSGLLTAGTPLRDVVAGVSVHGADIGRWLARQRAAWTKLSAGQRERLAQLGVAEAGAAGGAGGEAAVAPAAARGGRGAAWERGLCAARQYREREGHLTVPRAHVETVVDDGQEHAVKLGVWLSNQRSRRATLNAERAARLAVLGI